MSWQRFTRFSKNYTASFLLALSSNRVSLKTLGSFLRLVFSLGVSQNMHKITNLCKLELNCIWNTIIRQMSQFESMLTLLRGGTFLLQDSWILTAPISSPWLLGISCSCHALCTKAYDYFQMQPHTMNAQCLNNTIITWTFAYFIDPFSKEHINTNYQ